MKFHGFRSNKVAERNIAIGDNPPATSENQNGDAEKNTGATVDEDGSLEQVPSRDVQEGVKKVEAVTLTWTRSELIMAYAFIFLVFFMISMQQQIQFNLSYYVTSSFALLPLTGTTSIISSIVGGVFRLPTAKFINIVGRAEGFAIMTGFTTIALIMMAACRNVETYAAGQVFYWVGFNGMTYVLDVFMADTSSLKNRALVFAFSTTPYIVTTFIGPRAAQSFIETSGWPWGYGTFAIVTPVITIPILTLLWVNQRKAIRDGLLVKEESGRTVRQSVAFYFWEFDFIGLILICAGFVLVLLPFSLASYQSKGWRSGMIIAMLVIGFVCLFAFAAYEKFFAPKSFIPFHLLTDRSALGACLLSCFVFISFYLWDSYFYNYLQAVHGLSITNAGYVANIFSIGSCFWSVVVAVAIRISGRFKWVAMASMCLQILGVGLMIHFRQASSGIGYVVMCQIFIAFGGGALVICEEMAVMAAAPHEHVATMLALIALFTSVGGAIGQAISGAIYTNKFPAALDRALPGNKTLNAELYGSLPTQLLYPIGSPERTAVIHAYDESMWYLTIAATVFLVPCFGLIAIWKDFRVKDLRQVKGRVA
ncbi:Siderophore iron transporter-like protein [Venustampulla echinocandica]|uniref:Siderophore iron transporter-like protein n=1 Tax=Venustampulla echinocandica TaxID=2656787 RepID=A0A370U078_9HELO|nr:Siderophore iron transporter-like protein [Venustampulla echinocandica]RDL41180.1 Siderophore iron transporter-like protein [Venustampulla echinocandica]